MKILPAITTITPNLWREKILEIDRLGLKEVAAFVTVLNPVERQEFYKLLEKTKLKKIPFLHLREQDMDEREIEYLISRWGAERFNIHPREIILLDSFLPDYRDRIYVENTDLFLDEKYVRNFAGLCIDFSHLESDRVTSPERYEQIVRLKDKYAVGCGHASAIYDKPFNTRLDGSPEPGGPRIDRHYADSNQCFNYLARYLHESQPPVLAIELENSLAEQLNFIEYIKKLLK